MSDPTHFRIAVPIPNAYWVYPHHLLAGEHPMLPEEPIARQQLERLIGAGVGTFLDLTEEDEMPSYAPLLAELAPAAQLRYQRFAIPDMGTPSVEQLSQILYTIDHGRDAGHGVYVHCWGGIGRTGTVIGCYLVRQGYDGDAAIAEIARLRANTLDWRYPSPATEQQRILVQTWPGSRLG